MTARILNYFPICDRKCTFCNYIFIDTILVNIISLYIYKAIFEGNSFLSFIHDRQGWGSLLLEPLRLYKS